MKRFRLTPAAQRDLSEIWDFTEDRWSASQAESYLRDIQNAIERLAADPDRGRPVDDIRQGYRRYGIGSHLVFYVQRGDRIDVIRILHQRMNPGRHL
ncbi:type II toxin-antitoxin system RelE/ParE family toxin [Brachybacterium sp. ACRRE]|uniref:type II toxin-antitoxin system RelE/ParE family toxin n=1 Tax=Brachybacterium sp. ACRRE TaxID=2918184 RepID=UPI001EF39E1D|nr:type II toxin-antitoxin system RelE/ParE family toxin [Brachybacterium sp. ACRRE]MCG7307907.1 type II toxin-antitoxin system RelE/ParE family toxin [Brachybacterium sp. ACRRE]